MKRVKENGGEGKGGANRRRRGGERSGREERIGIVRAKVKGGGTVRKKGGGRRRRGEGTGVVGVGEVPLGGGGRGGLGTLGTVLGFLSRRVIVRSIGERECVCE